VHRARALVCTLPLGVLKARRVAFEPPLRGRARLIESAGWGHVVRILFRFRRGFWSAPFMPVVLGAKSGRAFGFVNAPGQAVPVWWALNPPAPVLTGWAGGDLADSMGRLSKKELAERALDSLARILGTNSRELRRWRVDWAMHDWRRDPFTLGAYSYPVAGHEDIAERLAEPIERTLFFAGEALAEDYGTVHGAIETGLRAGRDAAHALGAARGKPAGVSPIML
jgi:monoamine oxidase